MHACTDCKNKEVNHKMHKYFLEKVVPYKMHNKNINQFSKSKDSDQNFWANLKF